MGPDDKIDDIIDVSYRHCLPIAEEFARGRVKDERSFGRFRAQSVAALKNLSTKPSERTAAAPKDDAEGGGVKRHPAALRNRVRPLTCTLDSRRLRRW